MTVATIIDDGMGQHLATVAKCKEGGTLKTNFDETCYQDHIRYGEFENDGPNEQQRRCGAVDSNCCSGQEMRDLKISKCSVPAALLLGGKSWYLDAGVNSNEKMK